MMSAERFTVLVVNDEPLFHRILHTSLRSSGFAVEEVRTAEEALAVMRERTFDLALLYINTPGANGSTSVGKCAPSENRWALSWSAHRCRERHGSGARGRQISKREWMKFMEAEFDGHG
jgi:hypothetical protein